MSVIITLAFSHFCHAYSPENYILYQFYIFLAFSAVLSIGGNLRIIAGIADTATTITMLVFIFCMILPVIHFFIFRVFCRSSSVQKQRGITTAFSLIIIMELFIFIQVRDFACFHSRANSPSETSRVGAPNIILIVLDTARAKNISVYGYERRTTPNLEDFAKDAVTFTNAISPSSWTLPSHASLFTGLLPSYHGAVWGKDEKMPAIPLDDSHLTLAEILASQGYKTGAVVANIAYLHPKYGLKQGFSYYKWGVRPDGLLTLAAMGRRFLESSRLTAFSRAYSLKTLFSADQILDFALKWLPRKNARPYFLFANFMDVHGTEALPAPFDQHFGTSRGLLRFQQDEKTGLYNLTEEDTKDATTWYDNEMFFLDHQLGNLIRALKQRGMYENSLIIITSDHGEAFGEHHLYGHGLRLYDELLRVPLIVKYPNSEKKGTVFHGGVQNIDVFAEILDKVSSERLEGIQGQPFSHISHPAVAEENACPALASKYPKAFGNEITAIYSLKYPGYKLISYF